MIQKTSTLGLLFLILLLRTVQSQPVSVSEAAQYASSFMYGRSGDSIWVTHGMEAIEASVKRDDTIPLYYIINFRRGGFALISADKRFYPVLAYAFAGKFETGKTPENCQSWLDWYEVQMREALLNRGPFYSEMPYAWDQIVARPVSSLASAAEPLLTSRWDQFGYYNLFCPADTEAYNGHAPTGCVALAMAQLMYYYRFPVSGNGSELYTPTYNAGVYGPQYVDFSAALYNWSSMPDICHYPSEETAEICYHAGVSIQTSYKPESSGADIYDVPAALRDHFNYLADDFLPRNDVPGTPDWVALLMNNIDRGQPVLYRSTNGWGGHVYLCDGYQDSTHFHFNWGWGGAYNGYYYIDALTPGGMNLNLSQGAVLNIYPDTNLYSYPDLPSDTILLTDRSGSIDDGSGPYVYPANWTRSWLIQPIDSEVTNIFLEFSSFNTEGGSDILRVYDGSSSEAPLIASLSGNEVPDAVESTGPSLFLAFESDAQNHGQGFHASFYGFHLPFCTADQWFTSITGNLDDGSRFLHYRNDTDCEWVIAPYISPMDSVAAVRLNFDRFDLAYGDTLYLYNGIDRSSSLLGKFSSGDSPGSIVSASNQVLVRFLTDHQITAGGWEISWEHIRPVYCNDTALIFAPYDTIEDGSGGMNYCENSDCYYLIDLSNNPFITVRFLEFELENNYDFLKFYDADHPNMLLYRFSGYSLPEDVSFSVERLLIYFHSDDLYNFSGWKFSYTASSSGIPESNAAFSVYPNPSGNELIIHPGNAIVKPMEYLIYRPDGSIMLSGELQDSGQAIRLDSLSPGIYILALYQDGQRFHYKFIKAG